MEKNKVTVKNVYKIFGNQPQKAFDLLRQGRQKDEIFRLTGQTVGVKDASMQIKEGEIFVVMGLSGSGKSTLVRLLNRLIEPTSGQVLIDGEDIIKVDEKRLRQIRREKISMVFQSFALMPHMNVLDNVAFGLELNGIDKKTRYKAAQKALDQVGLSDHPYSYPDELSGGMQQRVGLARALANDPDIMLMDEAFSALDPLIRTEMQNELIALQEKDKRTVIFISHDLDEAMRIGDRIAIMQGGEVVQIGTPEEILHNPANDYVESFFKGVNVADIFTAKDICKKNQVTVVAKEGTGISTALQLMRDNDREFAYVVTRQQEFLGVVSLVSLKEAQKQNEKLPEAFISTARTDADTALKDLIGDVAKSPCGIAVVDENDKYLGVITKALLLEALDYGSEEESA